MTIRATFLGLICTVCLVAGCAPASNSQTAAPPSLTPEAAEDLAADADEAPADAKPSSEDAADSSATISQIDASLVQVGGKAEYEALLAERRGKVVLVDFWALWCGPCVQQFPHTAELSRELADEGLAVITVNFDDPDGSEDKVLAFLQKQNAAIPTLIAEHGVSTQSADEFEMAAGGALPSYKLYDRQGKLRYQFGALPADGEDLETPDKIDQRVTELLAEKPGE